MKAQLIIVGLILSAVMIAGCAQQPGPIVGNDTDEHGCKASAGYSWCEAKQKCIRIFEENCTLDECDSCPQLSPPAPGFCTGGTIVAGETNQCGCQGPPQCVRACTEEAKICPDGSAVGRTGPDCEFAPCPNICPLEEVLCIEGTEIINYRGDDGCRHSECVKRTTCTDEQKAAMACTLEYNPVCGSDGVTYGNKCSACASKNIDSYIPGECHETTYITTDLEQCKVIRYLCVKGKAAFSDEFGCGCEPEDTCGNGVCDEGEASECPACYYSTPPCLAPCTQGSCPGDCAAPDGKLKAHDCTEPRTQACTKEYMPVCGWRDVSLECNYPPCKQTYGNKCVACAEETVAYWTEGECPE